MCAHPKPFPPAAALLCAFTPCIGFGLLVEGLRTNDPLPPIRTSTNQTPVSMPMKATGFSPTSVARSTPMFAPVSTPRSSFYVAVETYALLSACGIYQPPLPDQVLIQNATAGKNPVPNCVIAPIGH